MEDALAQYEREYKLQFIELREQLNKIKWYEGEVTKWEKQLADPKRRKNQAKITKCMALAVKAIGVHRQVVEVIIQSLEYHEKLIETQKQLDALAD